LIDHVEFFLYGRSNKREEDYFLLRPPETVPRFGFDGYPSHIEKTWSEFNGARIWRFRDLGAGPLIRLPSWLRIGWDWRAKWGVRIFKDGGRGHGGGKWKERS